MPFVQYEVIIIHMFEEIVTLKFWTPHPYTPGGNRSSLFKDILEIALWGITKYIKIIEEILWATSFFPENETILAIWPEKWRQ